MGKGLVKIRWDYVKMVYICSTVSDFISCQKHLISLGYSWSSSDNSIFEPEIEGKIYLIIWDDDKTIGMIYIDKVLNDLPGDILRINYSIRELKLERIING